MAGGAAQAFALASVEATNVLPPRLVKLHDGLETYDQPHMVLRCAYYPACCGLYAALPYHKSCTVTPFAYPKTKSTAVQLYAFIPKRMAQP